MFKPKITVSKDLMDKCRQAAELMGCATVEEFIVSTLEKETDTVLSAPDTGTSTEDETEAIKRKLQGLGYID